MHLTITLSPVEVDALQLAFQTADLPAALHSLLLTVVEKTSEARLQRLATVYRELSPADQLEATQLLGEWRVKKEQAGTRVPPLDPPADAIIEPELVR